MEVQKDDVTLVLDEPAAKGTLQKLGRLRSQDPRDKKFLLPKANRAIERTQRYHMTTKAMDQGNTSECVAYSTFKYLVTYPVINRPHYPKTTDLYKDCQANDEWPGEDYDGTSVRAAMKVLKRDGYVSEYKWGFNAEDVIHHVLQVGPVIMGTDWTNDMFKPDKHGYIWFRGGMAGGHAWLIIGANRKKKNPDGTTGAVRMINSWGTNWGDLGRAWLTFQTLDELVKAEGEAAVPVEIKRKV